MGRAPGPDGAAEVAGGGGDRRSVARKLFAIADAFEGGRELTLSEVAASAGLPLATAHRLIGEWVEWGGLVRTEEGRYRLGLALWRLGVRQPTATRLRQAADPYLDDLLAVTGEHVHLAVLEQLEVVYLEHRQRPGALPIVSDTGTRLPPHATAVGQVLLAAQPESALQELVARGPRRFLPNTLTGERELRARLADVRRLGLARTDEEMSPSALSIAAPVRDAGRAVVAAVGIVVHRDRRGDPALETLVRMAARAISSGLARTGPRGGDSEVAS